MGRSRSSELSLKSLAKDGISTPFSWEKNDGRGELGPGFLCRFVGLEHILPHVILLKLFVCYNLSKELETSWTDHYVATEL